MILFSIDFRLMIDALEIFSLMFFIQVMQSAVCFANLAILVLTVSMKPSFKILSELEMRLINGFAG